MKKAPLSPKVARLIRAIREKLARDQSDPANQLTPQEAVTLAYKMECNVAFPGDFIQLWGIAAGSLLIMPNRVTIVCNAIGKDYEWPYPEGIERQAVCETSVYSHGYLRGSRIIVRDHIRVICAPSRIVPETELCQLLNRWRGSSTTHRK